MHVFPYIISALIREEPLNDYQSAVDDCNNQCDREGTVFVCSNCIFVCSNCIFCLQQLYFLFAAGIVFIRSNYSF